MRLRHRGRARATRLLATVLCVAGGFAALPAELGAAAGVDLSVAVVTTPAIDAGQSAVYVVGITNVGTVTASAPLTATVLTSVPVTTGPALGSWVCGAGIPTFAGYAYSCSIPGTLAPGASLTWLAGTIAPPAGSTSIQVSAFVQHPADTNTTNNFALSTTVVRFPDLEVSLSPGFAAVSPGASLAFAAGVRNLGAGTAKGTISLQFTRTGMSFLAAAGTGWTCSNTSTVTCTRAGPLASGATAPGLLVVATTVATPGTATLQMSTSHQYDSNASNNAMSAVVQIGSAPDLTVAVEPDGEWFVPGLTASFTVTVTNVGALSAGGTVTVMGYTSGFSDFRGVGTGWSCARDDLETLRCTHAGPLAPGASFPALSMKGGTLGEYPESIDLAVDVSATGDVNFTNDTGAASAPVAPSIGLQLDVDDRDYAVRVGGPIRYYVNVRNIGKYGSFGLVDVDFTATGLDLTGSGTGWTCVGTSCTRTTSVSGQGGTLPTLTLSGTLVDPTDEVSVDVVLLNDSDESVGDDADSETTPVLPSETSPPTGVSITQPVNASFTMDTPVPVAWTASDPSGIGAYDVETRRAYYSGTFISWASWLTSTQSTGATYGGDYGRTYCFRTRAEDKLSNMSALSVQKCTAVPLRSTSLSYSSYWTRYEPADAFAGVAYYSTTLGARATRSSIKAERLAVVVTKCPTCGTVRVYWNGVAVANLNLYAPTTVRKQVIVVQIWPTLQTGTAVVEVTSTGKIVVIEGLGVYQD